MPALPKSRLARACSRPRTTGRTSGNPRRRRYRYSHAAIESATVELTGDCRLVHVFDGGYEPHEKAGQDLFTELDAEPLVATVRSFVDLAVDTARAKLPADEHRSVDNATALRPTSSPDPAPRYCRLQDPLPGLPGETAAPWSAPHPPACGGCTRARPPLPARRPLLA
ncbi:hypothetical protein GCM10018980_16490 [Streptomyces capoamus]|uniref:Uncharacterized protein n=1 Tax=Streptomyces capoamus TaxID=68183 RepID=A0A919C4I3_9ACTN|nr:hypothetical protein GCM10010501_18060 [Streptomyces libani subsp. rufus]GHG41400.1 hypothetical protein GCM10018980_16490 [Streptomyces capoamus]